MKKKLSKYNKSNITRRLKAFSDDGLDVYYSAFFCFKRGNQKNLIINKLPFSRIESLSTHVNLELPDYIRLEVYDGKDAENVHWAKEYTLKDDETAVPETVVEIPKPTPTGLGEVEINNLVDQRLQEQKRRDDFDRMKLQNSELTTELEEQRVLIEELEEDNEQLRARITFREQLREYAGVAGTFLEGMGFTKDKLRKPLAFLMGLDDDKKSKETNDNKEDSSGIVEDDEPVLSQDEKRNEIITLIVHYLQNTTNQTLGEMFTIFSDIEQNPALAEKVLQFLHSKNQ